MSNKHKIRNQQGLYFVTLTVRHWIDVFTRNEYKIRAKDGCILQDIMRDFKKFTSKAIILSISNNPIESRKEWLLRGFKQIPVTDFGKKAIIQSNFGQMKLLSKKWIISAKIRSKRDLFIESRIFYIVV